MLRISIFFCYSVNYSSAYISNRILRWNFSYKCENQYQRKKPHSPWWYFRQGVFDYRWLCRPIIEAHHQATDNSLRRTLSFNRMNKTNSNSIEEITTNTNMTSAASGFRSMDGSSMVEIKQLRSSGITLFIISSTADSKLPPFGSDFKWELTRDADWIFTG